MIFQTLHVEVNNDTLFRAGLKWMSLILQGLFFCFFFLEGGHVAVNNTEANNPTARHMKVKCSYLSQFATDPGVVDAHRLGPLCWFSD